LRVSKTKKKKQITFFLSFFKEEKFIIIIIIIILFSCKIQSAILVSLHRCFTPRLLKNFYCNILIGLLQIAGGKMRLTLCWCLLAMLVVTASAFEQQFQTFTRYGKRAPAELEGKQLFFTNSRYGKRAPGPMGKYTYTHFFFGKYILMKDMRVADKKLSFV